MSFVDVMSTEIILNNKIKQVTDWEINCTINEITNHGTQTEIYWKIFSYVNTRRTHDMISDSIYGFLDKL